MGNLEVSGFDFIVVLQDIYNFLILIPVCGYTESIHSKITMTLLWLMQFEVQGIENNSAVWSNEHMEIFSVRFNF